MVNHNKKLYILFKFRQRNTHIEQELNLQSCGCESTLYDLTNFN